MTAPIQDHSQTRDLHRWVRLAFIIALLALVGWLGWRALRSGLSARAVLNDLDRLQATMAQPSLDALPRVQADIASLETHLKEVRAAAGPFLRLTPSLGWAPRFGPDLVLAPQLLDMAVELSTAGRIAVDTLAPIGELVSGGGGLDALPQAVDALQAAQDAVGHSCRPNNCPSMSGRGFCRGRG